MELCINSIHQAWADRDDFFVGGNMFVYYSLDQARAVTQELKGEVPGRWTYRGPDVFVVLGVDGTIERQTWVVWEEGGRYPDVIIELLSPSTEAKDLGEKKQLYEQVFRTPEYFVHDPWNPDRLQGWRLANGSYYEPIEPDERGWLWSRELSLWLGLWEGKVHQVQTAWLRFYNAEGKLAPTPAEAAEQRAAEEAAARAAAEAEVARLRAQLAELREP